MTIKVIVIKPRFVMMSVDVLINSAKVMIQIINVMLSVRTKIFVKSRHAPSEPWDFDTIISIVWVLLNKEKTN